MMLDYAYWITQGLLAAGALCAVYRVYRGPSVLDRVISVDVILIIVSSVMLADMAYNSHQDYIMFVVISAVIGFLGAVAIARYVVTGGTAGQDSAKEAEKQAAGIAWEPAPEPEIPASPFAPTAGSGAQTRTDEDESTSWFTALTKSGFRPSKNRTETEGDD